MFWKFTLHNHLLKSGFIEQWCLQKIIAIGAINYLLKYQALYIPLLSLLKMRSVAFIRYIWCVTTPHTLEQFLQFMGRLLVDTHYQQVRPLLILHITSFTVPYSNLWQETKSIKFKIDIFTWFILRPYNRAYYHPLQPYFYVRIYYKKVVLKKMNGYWSVSNRWHHPIYNEVCSIV